MFYSTNAKMRSFFQSTTITVIDKMTIKKFVNIIVDEIMNYPITEIGSENLSLDWVLNDKANAWTYCICSIY